MLSVIPSALISPPQSTVPPARTSSLAGGWAGRLAGHADSVVGSTVGVLDVSWTPVPVAVRVEARLHTPEGPAGNRRMFFRFAGESHRR